MGVESSLSDGKIGDLIASPDGANVLQNRKGFRERVLILGTGISGVSVARELLSDGNYDVQHWTDPSFPAASPVAAAFWYPVCATSDKMREWAESTFADLQQLSETAPDAGVTMTPTRDLHRKERAEPDWISLVPDFRHAQKNELPPGFIDAYHLTVPVANTRFFLKFLMAQNLARGVKVEGRKIEDIEEAFSEYDIVVNTTGLGSRMINGIKDEAVVPVRGQLVRVQNPGIREIVMDEDRPDAVYFCPRPSPDGSQDDLILGGTFERGETSLIPDPVTAQRIIDGCAEFYGAIRNAKILDHLVGLRPMREGDGIRVHAQTRPDGKRRIDNIGHGGSGYTIYKGCAEDAVKLIVG